MWIFLSLSLSCLVTVEWVSECVSEWVSEYYIYALAVICHYGNNNDDDDEEEVKQIYFDASCFSFPASFITHKCEKKWLK